MNVRVKDLFQILNTIAPFSLAESWDNCGLQAGDYSWPVKKVLVALDVSMAAMEYAAKIKADLLLTHHPLMLGAPESMDFGKMPGAAVAMAAINQIAILSVHTNLDKAAGGLNDFFSERLGVKTDLALLPEEVSCIDFEEAETCRPKKSNSLPVGIGRIGSLDSPISLRRFAEMVKERFRVPTVRVVGDLNLDIRHVAVCTGSGGSLLKAFFKSQADLYVTGDIKYHEARDVEVAGRGLIDLGHFASEQIAVTLLEDRLKACVLDHGFSLEVVAYRDEHDPFLSF